jgi:hypothetical protein
MPVRLVRAPEHDRTRSLGWLACWWLETFVVHGAGDVAGMRTVLSDERTGFIVDCYALDGRGRRLYDSAFFSRPKGADKSGVAGKVALFEAFGPARFAGWAEGGETYEFLDRVYVYAAGEPMGRPVTNPFVRIMATEEEQTGAVYETIQFNLTHSDAPLYELQGFGVVAGMNRVAMPWGGEIRRSTAGAASKDGGRETFAVFDETHLYTTPQLRSMYSKVVDNLKKRALHAEPWFIETTTMYEVGAESVAEQTYRLADLIFEGKARRARLLFNHRWASPESLRDEGELATAFAEAYGDAIEWNPIEDLINGVFDTRRSEARTRRLFFNALVAAENAWMLPEVWNARGQSVLRQVLRESGSDDFTKPAAGDEITLGFDGSRTNDATALVACRVRDRFVFPLLIDEIPDGPESEGWEVDTAAVDAAVAQAFDRFTVVGFYADPPYWLDYIDRWAKEFGEQLRIHSSGKHSIAWYTKRDVQMSEALERVQQAVTDGTMGHDDVTPLGAALTRHVLNARNWLRRGGAVIGKEGKNSPRKIDAAVAMTLAFEAAADYAAQRKPAAARNDFVPFFIR